jgi:hypothetical protein
MEALDIGGGGGAGGGIENLQLVVQIALTNLHSEEIIHKWQILFLRGRMFISFFK